MFDPIGTLDPTPLWRKSFTSDIMCGWGQYIPDDCVHPPVMFTTDFPRLIRGRKGTIQSLITYRDKDGFDFAPELLHIDRLTGEILATTPTRLHGASDGQYGKLGGHWGTKLRVGDACVSECSDIIDATFGGDHWGEGHWNAWTGVEDTAAYFGGTSNWTGVAKRAWNNPRNIFNLGVYVPTYDNTEYLWDYPVLSGDFQWKASQTSIRCLNINTHAYTVDRALPGPLLSPLILGPNDSVLFFATVAGRPTLYWMSTAGSLVGSPVASYTQSPLTFKPCATSEAVYNVRLSGATAVIDEYSLTTGAIRAVSIPATNSPTLLSVATNKGFLVVQLKRGNNIELVCLKGSKTDLVTRPVPPVSGYVPHAPVEFKVPGVDLAGAKEILPSVIASPNPTQPFSGATYPKLRIAFGVPSAPGYARYLVAVTYVYVDDIRDKGPYPYWIWECGPIPPAPSTRFNVPPVIGPALYAVDIGKIRSNVVTVYYDVTANVLSKPNAATLYFAIEGTEGDRPEYFGMCTKNPLPATIKMLAVGTGSVPEPPPVDPPPPQTSWKFDFGTAPAVEGWTKIGPTKLYAPGGYGFTAVVKAFDRATNPVTRDGCYEKAFTFKCDVPDGKYRATITTGDEGDFPHDNMTIVLNGLVAATNVSTAAREVKVLAFDVTVAGGMFILSMSDGGGVDPNCTILALSVEVIQ